MTVAVEYDLLVAGAGPAGCAAAIAARGRGLRVLLVERGGEAAVRCAGWAGPAAVEFCRTIGVDLAACGAEYHGLQLWPGDFATPARVDDPELTGCVVDPARLYTALRTAAHSAGAELINPGALRLVQLGERAVTAELHDGRTVTAQVLVIADGAGSATARLANLLPAPADGVNGRAAVAVLPARKSVPGIDVVLGGGRGLRLTTIARLPHETRVTLLTRDADVPATAQLASVLKSAARAELVPPGAVHPAACPCLAGAALEFEAHVQKRALLVGEAGGFVAAFSQDGLYPALRSGWLAAETAAGAIAAPVLQDALATYSASWRAELAEYLRLPNTDLGLLLPMVFTNPQMSRRVARAFLLGRPF